MMWTKWTRHGLGQKRQERSRLQLETLDERIVPAITATFSPADALLTVTGDGFSNTILVSRDAAGQIQINKGAVVSTGGTPSIVNTALIRVVGNAGNDTITFDE